MSELELVTLTAAILSTGEGVDGTNADLVLVAYSFLDEAARQAAVRREAEQQRYLEAGLAWPPRPPPLVIPVAPGPEPEPSPWWRFW